VKLFDGYACSIVRSLNSTMAEAHTLLCGIQFLEPIRVSKVIIESDSLKLIQACNCLIEVVSPHTTILGECFMKAHSFDFIKFVHGS
jgi:hypothetical protein